MNVDTGTNVSQKSPIACIARNTDVVDPAVFAVMVAQPILHAKLCFVIEMADIDLDAALVVFRMDALGPPIAEFLRHRASGKFKPRPVEPTAKFVLAGYPDHDRCCIHYFIETPVQTAKWFNRDAA